MPQRLYLAQLTTHPTRPTMTISRCELYPRALASNIVANPVKAWCLTLVDATDEQQAVIAADAGIRPLGGDLALDTLYGDLPEGIRTAIETAAENNRVPIDWIGPATTIRDVVRMIIRLLLLAQLIKADFPEADLDLAFSTIPAAQRNRILTWCANNGVSTTGLTNSTPIRAIVRALVVRYPNWTIHRLGSWEI